MQVVIIEDEKWAAEGLTRLINQFHPKLRIIAYHEDIKTSVEWFQKNPAPDLIFCDIQLTDGLSFEIFQSVTISCPIIFTTAYDQYALKAFELNSIDYLLKPIDGADLSRALGKYDQLVGKSRVEALSIDTINQVLSQIKKPNFKNRFVVKAGSRLLSIPIEEVLYFFSESKITWIRRSDGKKYAINYSIVEVESMLDSNAFHQLGRAIITSHNGIVEIITYSNSRLKVYLKFMEDAIVVSRDRVGAFKEWLG